MSPADSYEGRGVIVCGGRRGHRRTHRRPVQLCRTVWRSLASAEKGIRVNCTLPGPTDTPVSPAFEEQMGKAFRDNYPIPPGHRQTPDEKAAPLVFLISPPASAVTGESLLADGGTMAALSVDTLDVSAFGL